MPYQAGARRTRDKFAERVHWASFTVCMSDAFNDVCAGPSEISGFKAANNINAYSRRCLISRVTRKDKHPADLRGNVIPLRSILTG